MDDISKKTSKEANFWLLRFRHSKFKIPTACGLIIKSFERINNIGPGVFASPTAIANYGPLGEVMFGNTAKITPAGKIGDVDAHLVAPIIFMLSPGVCYTTGQTLDVCGGVSLYNHYYQQYMKITQPDSTE